VVIHVLDSTVLIDYLRGLPAVARVAAVHDRGDRLATTAINVEEIVRGLRGSETPTRRAGSSMAWRCYRLLTRRPTSDGIRLSPLVCRLISPREMDLIARPAGLVLAERWGGWQRQASTADSAGQVSVFARSASKSMLSRDCACVYAKSN
jgi:predicted nucleic acid-binding protein